jgi:hypothetical protein
MPSPSHPPWFHHSKYTWWIVQITKHFIIHLLSLHPLQSKYSPQCPILKHPQSMFLP